jgi:hypothetical protein
MTAQVADVGLRNGEYIVSSYSQTDDGFWIADGTPTRLPDSASAGELGQAIRNALEQSRQNVPTPPRDADTAKPLLDMLGLPDYATYAKGTRSVSVRATTSSDGGESIKVTPERNEGARGGFTPIQNQASVFLYDSPGQLGKEVIKAFKKAT